MELIYCIGVYVGQEVIKLLYGKSNICESAVETVRFNIQKYWPLCTWQIFLTIKYQYRFSPQLSVGGTLEYVTELKPSYTKPQHDQTLMKQGI